MSIARPELKCAGISEKIIGIFNDVYNELGHGFLESVYAKSMVIALRESGLKVNHQLPIPVWFKEQQIDGFRAGLLAENDVLVELKSVRVLEPAHDAQLLHYLKSTEIEVGLLLNSAVKPQFRGLVFDNTRRKIRTNPCESVAKAVA
jgi:GxxExxY protein